MKNMAEVKGILDTEYNEAEVMELFRNDGIKEGFKEGIKEGTNKTLVDLVKSNIITIKVAAEKAGVTEEDFKKMMNK